MSLLYLYLDVQPCPFHVVGVGTCLKEQYMELLTRGGEEEIY